jgi:cell division protein FtsN
MTNLLSKIIIIFLAFGFFSCTKNKKEAVKIRVVDLQGQPGSVQIKTPDLNVDALRQQGKTNLQYVDSNKVVEPNNYQKNNLNNNYNATQAPDLGLPQPENSFTKIIEQKSDKKENVADDKNANNKVVYLLNSKDSKDSKDKENKNIFGSQNADQSIEIDLSKEEPALEVNKPKKPITKVTNGKKYFVQVGSFTEEKNATNSLAYMKKFHQGVIQQGNVNNSITHRVLLGPFVNRVSAQKLLNKVKKSGHNAILVKGN